MHQYAKVLRDMSEPVAAGKGEAMAYGSIGSSGDGNCRVNADWLKDTIDQRAELLAALKKIAAFRGGCSPWTSACVEIAREAIAKSERPR